MGGASQKQLMRVGGRPMLIFSLERLRSHPAMDTIIITCPADRIDDVQRIVHDFSVPGVALITGGPSRQASVRLALAEVGTPRVLVHEAARPMITHDLIDRVVKAEGDAVVPTWEVPFTVAAAAQPETPAGGTDLMAAEVPRATLRNVQLPQVFDTEVLRSAHVRARELGEESTEDSALVFRMGRAVTFVEGAADNLKVTYPVDAFVVHSFMFGAGSE